MNKRRWLLIPWSLLGVVALCTLGYWALPQLVYVYSGDQHLRIKTSQNARQIAFSVEKFVHAHGGKYPTHFKTVEDLRSCVIEFSEPGILRSYNTSKSAFLPNPNLEGLEHVTIRDPERTVLAYENVPWPNKERIIVFCDAHVTWSASFSSEDLFVDLSLLPKN